MKSLHDTPKQNTLKAKEKERCMTERTMAITHDRGLTTGEILTNYVVVQSDMFLMRILL